MIAVLHAYSRANAGDGLLVDLALERLNRAGVPSEEVLVVAMEPASFADLPRVAKLGTPGRKPDLETMRAAWSGSVVRLAAAMHRPIGATSRLLSGVDGYLAVGGGYLRAGNRVNMLGTLINHLPPLSVAAYSDKPSLYLPQSIGPLTGRVGNRVRRLLSEIDEVHVRDNRSVAELSLPNVRRTPDLAVLELAESLSTVGPRSVVGPPMIVARALSEAPDYIARLHALAAELGTVTWGVQTEGSADKSDRTFYHSIGVHPGARVVDLLAAGQGPVVSVRLHGALQSLIAGVPAIHLGYERKSWGAYADLGLERFVHSARSFDPKVVAAQVRELQEDPSAFWGAVHRRAEQLRATSSELDASVRRLVAGQ
jgi:polysaccharide pyruvyl transferase WcaK-like protein